MGRGTFSEKCIAIIREAMSGRNPNKDVHSRKNGGALIICCKICLISEQSTCFEFFLQKKQEIGVYLGFYLYFCSKYRLIVVTRRLPYGNG